VQPHEQQPEGAVVLLAPLEDALHRLLPHAEAHGLQIVPLLEHARRLLLGRRILHHGVAAGVGRPTGLETCVQRVQRPAHVGDRERGRELGGQRQQPELEQLETQPDARHADSVKSVVCSVEVCGV